VALGQLSRVVFGLEIRAILKNQQKSVYFSCLIQQKAKSLSALCYSKVGNT
jgi:hypothetical protein